MGLILRTNPTGIDKAIQRHQKGIYAYLTGKVGWTEYNCYGRVYKNETMNGLNPEAFITGVEYDELFFNDKFNITSFYIVGDIIQYDEVLKVKLSMIYQAKLSKLFPAVTHRADEEMHAEIRQYLGYNRYQVEFKEMSTGISNVYREFDKSKIKWDDMSDFHVVRFETELAFEEECHSH